MSKTPICYVHYNHTKHTLRFKFDTHTHTVKCPVSLRESNLREYVGSILPDGYVYRLSVSSADVRKKVRSKKSTQSV